MYTTCKLPGQGFIFFVHYEHELNGPTGVIKSGIDLLCCTPNCIGKTLYDCHCQVPVYCLKHRQPKKKFHVVFGTVIMEEKTMSIFINRHVWLLTDIVEGTLVLNPR